MANYYAAASGTGDATAVTGKARLLGISARESGATADVASFVIRDGTSTAGAGVAFFELGPDQSINGSYGDIDGIEMSAGIFIDRTAGTTEITVYY